MWRMLTYKNAKRILHSFIQLRNTDWSLNLHLHFIFYCCITNYHKFGRLNTHTFIISQLSQESQYGLGGSSVSQDCNQDLVLESHLKLDWGRICLLAHVVINRNKVLKLSDEGLSNVLTITQRSPLFPSQMDLSIWQCDSSKPAKKSTEPASKMKVITFYNNHGNIIISPLSYSVD